MDAQHALKGHRGDLLRIAKAHGVTQVRVFGSVARGEAGPDSDLDLLVDLEPQRSLLDLIAFEQELAEALDVRVDALTDGSLHERIRERVLAEARPL